MVDQIKEVILNSPKYHKLWIKENYDQLIDSFLEAGDELPPFIWQNYLEFCYDVACSKFLKKEVASYLIKMKLLLLNGMKFGGDLEKCLDHYHDHSLINFKSFADKLLDFGDYTQNPVTVWEEKFHDQSPLTFKEKMMVVGFIFSFYSLPEKQKFLSVANDSELIKKQNEHYEALRNKVAKNIYNITHGKTNQLIDFKEGFAKLMSLGYLTKYTPINAYILEYYSKMFKHEAVKEVFKSKLGEQEFKEVLKAVDESNCLHLHNAKVKAKAAKEYFNNAGFANPEMNDFNPLSPVETTPPIQQQPQPSKPPIEKQEEKKKGEEEQSQNQ